MNVTTGEKRSIASEDAVQPNWSPHGYRIAYWTQKGGQRDIGTISADGGNPVMATGDVAVDWNPVWSPDGNHLYFLSDRGGSMNAWRVPIEEKTGRVLGAPEPLSTPASDAAFLSISHDGRRIAYVQQAVTTNIQRIGFDPRSGAVAGQAASVTEGSRRAGFPSVSPDGEWIVFSTTGAKQEDLFVIRKDGAGQRQLTDDAYKDRAPRWSPDGRRIAFYSNRGGQYEIWTIEADGSGLRQLTFNSPGNTNYPVWSPDGARLAYGIQAPRKVLIIELAKAGKDQAPQALPPWPEPDAGFIPWSWSADGRLLAGTRERNDGTRAGIWVYSLESGQYERLLDFGAWPVWLNDSRRLVFSHQGKLYLLDTQTKKTRELLPAAPHNIGNPVLSPDNRIIYFQLTSTEADIWLATLQ